MKLARILSKNVMAMKTTNLDTILKSSSKKTASSVVQNVTWHSSPLSRTKREERNGYRGKVVWLTGLPGAGKSTIAHAIEAKLHRSGLQTVVLDGDNIRHGLCSDLGFSTADRNENIRRVGEVARLFLEQGTLVFVALVSPVRSAREQIRALLPDGDFIEIYCNCPLAICRQRDPKGLYAKAESGLIPEFTGISSPYEAPLDPALTLDTGTESIEESVNRLTQFLRDRVQVSS